MGKGIFLTTFISLLVKKIKLRIHLFIKKRCSVDRHPYFTCKKKPYGTSDGYSLIVPQFDPEEDKK